MKLLPISHFLLSLGRRTRLVPDHPTPRHIPPVGLCQPQVRRATGRQDHAQVPVPAQSQAGVQSGQGRTHAWPANVQGGAKCQDHRLRGRRDGGVGAGCAG